MRTQVDAVASMFDPATAAVEPGVTLLLLQVAFSGTLVLLLGQSIAAGIQHAAIQHAAPRNSIRLAAELPLAHACQSIHLA
jgi:hypothetical protein